MTLFSIDDFITLLDMWAAIFKMATYKEVIALKMLPYHNKNEIIKD
jgi:hypothetical protein